MSKKISFVKSRSYFKNSSLVAALLGNVWLRSTTLDEDNGGGAKNRRGAEGGAVLLFTSSALPQPHIPLQCCHQ